jgi:alpha-L-fucosidase 2
MKRRDFLKTSAAAAGLVGTLEVSPLLGGEKCDAQTGAPHEDNRPADYLQRVQADRFLPKLPVIARSYPIISMPLTKRVSRKLVPSQGFCSITPGELVSESLTCGNGAMTIELMGEPYAEQILFHHESLLMPWKKPLEAPKVAEIFQQVRQMVLAGKDREAMTLAYERMSDSAIKPDTEPHPTIPAFLMHLDLPKTASVHDYLRTLDFETGEAKIYWSDEHGEWVRSTFTSRPDNVVVQWLTAPKGKTLNVRISLQKSAEWTVFSGMDWGSHLGINSDAPDRVGFSPLPPNPNAAKGVEANTAHIDLEEQHLVYKCVLDKSVDNSGYAGVVRVVRNGGSSRIDGDTLVVENASSLMLLTRIEYYSDFSDDKVAPLVQAVGSVEGDYVVLLDRHRKVQSEMLNRVTVNFGGGSQSGMSTEELLSDQRSRPDYSPALLENMFGMGRHWFISNSGKYPSIAAEVNGTIDLQTAGAVQGNLREGMDAYFNWMESLAPDCRVNAKNTFGLRGAAYPLFPDKGVGANYFYTGSSGIGIWPYWISAGGWYARQFWDHYLTTGDTEFLRNRVVPIYKDLALFYEDFLTATDSNGKYIFAPSISPENVPVSTDTSKPALVNATMDIAVCREVLTTLVRVSEILGTDSDGIAKWKAMLAKMPPYLVKRDGTLKEWAWPTVDEHYNHRHISHLYGAWPGDEFDADRTPQLARAAVIANRRRTFDTLATAVAGETLAAYARCHRALVGARLKDNVIVDIQMRQLIEQGYVSNALRCSREPYGVPVPDAQAGIPAIVMEMLCYSRPGLIEVLPALPTALSKGSIQGMLARTFARIDKLAWDMDARTVELTVTSFREQTVTLMARYGIAEITAPTGALVAPLQTGEANIDVHLPENKSVSFRIKLGHNKPIDWVDLAESA